MAWYSYLRRGENGASALREGSELEQSRSQSLSMADQPLLAVAGGPDGDGHPAENTPAAENKPANDEPAAGVGEAPSIDTPSLSGLVMEPGARDPHPAGHHRVGGVALALGGGVAKGWAHIGVLRAVEEYGLPVKMIAGTSIGALVGGAYLSGAMDELETFARSLTKSNVVRYLDFTLRGSGLISGARLAARMEEHMSEVSIEELSRPFVAVATDIQSGHEVWLSDGPIVPAIRASYALPGVFTPVQHGGRQLVDGALVNPVPVSVCRAYEPDIVIAVNLAGTSFGKGTVIRQSHYGHIEDALTENVNSQAASWFSFMHSREKATPRENRLGVTSVMVEAFNIIQDRIARARLAGEPPDFTIRPKLGEIGLIDFHKADEAIRLGYDEMMMRLRELEDQGVLDQIVSL